MVLYRAVIDESLSPPLQQVGLDVSLAFIPGLLRSELKNT